jgi:pyruvate,water dikinase
LSNYPNKGVGLMRMEFAISNSIKIHPLALWTRKVTDKAVTDQISELTKGYKDSTKYFDKLAEAVSINVRLSIPKMLSWEWATLQWIR